MSIVQHSSGYSDLVDIGNCIFRNATCGLDVSGGGETPRVRKVLRNEGLMSDCQGLNLG